MHIKLFFVLMGVITCFTAGAQTQQQKVRLPYQPSRAEIMQRYRHMMELDSSARNALFKMRVLPNWQADGNSFWYSNNNKDSTTEYIYVDAVKGTKQPAFDHQRMAVALTKASGKKANPSRLNLFNIVFDNNKNQVTVDYNNAWYTCDLSNYTCTPQSGAPVLPAITIDPHTPPRWQRDVKRDSLSPDRQWIAYIKDGNVFVKSIDSTQVIQFTTDGAVTQPYGSLYWSPDSKYVVGYKIDPREEKEVYYVLSSQPNTFRGVLRSHAYAQPGDEFTSYEMYIFNLAAKQPLKVNTEKYNFLGQPWLRWSRAGAGNNSRYFTYEKADRGHQRFRIIEVDAETGNTRNIIDEKTNTFIYEQRIFTFYIPETNEIIWSSEKDGWRHLYLVDAIKGTIKNQITKGEWVVREIDSVDTKKREIWFRANGMNPGEDPYNRHVYRISFDGKKLVSLTPATGNHTITYSPDRKYYIDTWSQPTMAPIHALCRTADGKQLMQLEQADISVYAALGIKPAEVFVAKGRDGKTDIWGTVCRPSHFDSTKQYPVIENIYAGPQDAFVQKNFMSWGEMQSMAELGFIVVQCDGMGTANRSKAFHDVCWKNLADAGLPDRIAWIKALAVKYPYIDITRVGVYGTSAGGQNSTGAVLFHPEFYKAAVSACGCHDNRIDKQWWNEQWMGYPVEKHYDEQSNITNAAKLQGKLMLIVGEADTNVPPESTYRLADALIKAGKTFDFLAVPGMGHGDGGVYGRAKKRDFFVKNLLGVDPPDRNANELTTIQTK
jgi:dipeptidyl aminopeptidase/acylaminoacyl peptidase